jgi:hypothetical protein
VAEQFPDGQWGWVYTQDKLQVRAVEIALAMTKKIESRRGELGETHTNEILALREGWVVLLESLHKQAIKLQAKRERYNQKRRRKANG